MSAINPRTIEELLGMPTDDIAKINNEELTQWCMKFWPHTRPADVAKSALTREAERDREKLETGGDRMQAVLAAARAKMEAAKQKNITKLKLPPR